MKVRATAEGHYGIRRHEGDVFHIKDEKHLGSWMEVVEQAGPAEESDIEEGQSEEKPLAKRPIAELRDMAEARGIDHADVSKADLAAAIESHDNPQGNV